MRMENYTQSEENTIGVIRRCCESQRVKELRDTVMSRLRRPSGLCSSTLSVNCEKAEKDTLR